MHAIRAKKNTTLRNQNAASAAGLIFILHRALGRLSVFLATSSFRELERVNGPKPGSEFRILFSIEQSTSSSNSICWMARLATKNQARQNRNPKLENIDIHSRAETLGTPFEVKASDKETICSPKHSEDIPYHTVLVRSGVDNVRPLVSDPFIQVGHKTSGVRSVGFYLYVIRRPLAATARHLKNGHRIFVRVSRKLLRRF